MMPLQNFLGNRGLRLSPRLSSRNVHTLENDLFLSASVLQRQISLRQALRLSLRDACLQNAPAFSDFIKNHVQPAHPVEHLAITLAWIGCNISFGLPGINHILLLRVIGLQNLCTFRPRSRRDRTRAAGS